MIILQINAMGPSSLGTMRCSRMNTATTIRSKWQTVALITYGSVNKVVDDC